MPNQVNAELAESYFCSNIHEIQEQYKCEQVFRNIREESRSYIFFLNQHLGNYLT